MKARDLADILQKDPRFTDITVERDAYAKSLSFRFIGDPYVVSYTGVGLNIRVAPRYQYLQGILFDILARFSSIVSDGKSIPAGRYLVLDAVHLGDCVVSILEGSNGEIKHVQTQEGQEIHRDLERLGEASKSSTESEITRHLLDT